MKVTYIEYPDASHEDALPALNDYGGVEIVPASREHVSTIAHLLAEEFGYLYTGIFAVTRDAAPRLARAILLASGGRHSLGYRSFDCAIQVQSGRCIGVFLAVPYIRFGAVVAAWVAARCIGLVGFSGLWKAWRRARRLSGDAIAEHADALSLVYLVVVESCRGQGVGSRMVEAAARKARDRHRTALLAEVREKNARARNFFRRHGFQEGAVVSGEADQLFGQGARIIFRRKVV